MDLILQKLRQIRYQIQRVILGHEDTIDFLMVALLCEGHVILEGVPGTGKTLLARTFTKSLGLQFKRIQFTPDLMPADIIGSNIFNFQTNQFLLRKGPIFTEFLLADEINRTPPKTQAALLEAMQERAVTIDGTTHPLSRSFLVVATQNPIEQEGTYPLPEAQLDRFLFKLVVGFPSQEQEQKMIRLHGHQSAMPDLEGFGLQPVLDQEEINLFRQSIRQIHVSDELVAYIVSLVRATRNQTHLLHGASPRASNMLAIAGRALAGIQGRNYVIPDDIKSIFLPGLRHRVILTPSAYIEGLNADAILKQVLESIPAPK